MRWKPGPWLAACAGLVSAPLATGTDFGAPGPHAPGWRTVSVSRPGAGTTFSARLYYPATSAGQNAPLDASGAPYPAVSFGHGFFQPVSRYQSTLERLATHGVLVIASESEGSLFPSHANFAADIRHCLTHLEVEHQTPGAFLFGVVDTGAFGVSGHSMGGGACMLAAAADTRIKAVAPLAAAETNPSALAVAPMIAVPHTQVCGTADTVVPPGPNGQAMFSAARAPRRLLMIQGGFHCGFEDVTSIGCDAGNGTLSRPEQLAITQRALTAFFLLHLRGDQSAWRAVWGPESQADARVVATNDSGATFAPPAPSSSGGGATGSPAALCTLTVMNTGLSASAFEMFAEGGAWPATLEPAITEPLAPGASREILLRVAVPPGPGGATDALLVSARREAEGARAFTVVTIRRVCFGDTNGDNAVTFADLNTVLAQFGMVSAPGSLSGDLNGDGAVTFADLNIVLGAFGTTC